MIRARRKGTSETAGRMMIGVINAAGEFSNIRSRVSFHLPSTNQVQPSWCRARDSGDHENWRARNVDFFSLQRIVQLRLSRFFPSFSYSLPRVYVTRVDKFFLTILPLSCTLVSKCLFVRGLADNCYPACVKLVSKNYSTDVFSFNRLNDIAYIRDLLLLSSRLCVKKKKIYANVSLIATTDKLRDFFRVGLNFNWHERTKKRKRERGDNFFFFFFLFALLFFF